MNGCFDNHAIAPDTLEKAVTAVGADLFEAKPLHEGAARQVLGKDPANSL